MHRCALQSLPPRSTVTDVTALRASECHYENEMQFHLAGCVLEQKAGKPAFWRFAVVDLDRAPQREWLEVVEVPQGRGTTRSLAQLGIFLNEKVRVRGAAPWRGPVLVDVGGTTVAIGRCLANRIKVRLLKRDGREPQPRPGRHDKS